MTMRTKYVNFLLAIWGTPFLTASIPMKEAAEAIRPIMLKDGPTLIVGLYKVARP